MPTRVVPSILGYYVDERGNNVGIRTSVNQCIRHVSDRAWVRRLVLEEDTGDATYITCPSTSGDNRGSCAIVALKVLVAENRLKRALPDSVITTNDSDTCSSVTLSPNVSLELAFCYYIEVVSWKASPKPSRPDSVMLGGCTYARTWFALGQIEMISALSKLRRLVDLWPLVGRGARDLRDHFAELRDAPADTGLGFSCSGNASMQGTTFEMEETRFIRQALADVDLFVDVGANIGYYTCLALSHQVPAIAFEPSPRNVRRLLRNLVLNNYQHGVEVIPVALSNKPCVTKLYGRNTGASMVSGWSGASEIDFEFVPVSTLDALLGPRISGKRALIKVDVEGAEFGLLQGAGAVLSATPKPLWLIEICLTENLNGGINTTFEDVFRLFWEAGYHAYTLEDAARRIEESDVKLWIRTGKRTFGTHNFVFRESR